MKSKIFLVGILLLGTVLQSSAQSFTKTGRTILKPSDGRVLGQSYAVSTDSALQTIDSIIIASGEAGIVEVQVLGYNDSLDIAVTGKQIVRYKKVGGTLTLGTPEDVLAKATDSGLGTATFSISASGNNIIIRVKGRLNYNVKWHVLRWLQKNTG